MKKIYASLLMLFAMLIFSGNASAYRIYVDNQTSWSNLSCYAWYSGQPEFFGSWPGAAPAGIENIDGTDYHYWEIGEAGDSYKLIFNNSGAGSQLADYEITFDKDYYLEINNLGCIEKGGLMEIHRIYVDDQSGWNSLHLYGWGEGSVQHLGGWPGSTPTGFENIDGVDYKYFEVAASNVACNLIFNNGEGSQFDGPIVMLDKDYFFRITSSSYTVISGDIEPTPDPNPQPTFNGGINLYLNPTDVWSPDGAWFALYVFGANGDAWATMTDLNADGIYEVVTPEGEWTGLIFVRQNPANTTPSWENQWGQTYDLTYDGINNKYTITGWAEDGKASGDWSVYDGSATPDPDPNPQPTFNGGFNVYLQPGDAWSPDGAWFALYIFNINDNYNEWIPMTDEDADGIYETYLPEGAWNGLIFVRQNPENAVAGWENHWGQTEDLTYDGINNLCVITGWGAEGKATHQWTVFNPGDNPDPQPDPEPTAYHRLYINDCSGWLMLNIYAFVDNSKYQPLGAWPGAEFVDFVEIDGVSYKYYELPETENTYNLIFSNNGDFQFNGPAIVANKDYYFKVTSNSYEEIEVNSINNIETDNNAPAEYYNLQGVRVSNPENGLFIRRQGNKVEKIFVEN